MTSAVTAGSDPEEELLAKKRAMPGWQASGMLPPLSILVKIRVALIPGRIARATTPNAASSMFRHSTVIRRMGLRNRVRAFAAR
jgi:hypothetical protein